MKDVSLLLLARLIPLQEARDLGPYGLLELAPASDNCTGYSIQGEGWMLFVEILFRIQSINFRSISLFQTENGQTPTHIFSQCLRIVVSERLFLRFPTHSSRERKDMALVHFGGLVLACLKAPLKRSKK
jgi:hypothetical protein